MPTLIHRADGVTREAVISEDGRYRYRLSCWWERPEPANYATVLFVLCNPSTADHTKDDATTKRLTGFAKRWGCSGWTLVNVCAYRATYPIELLGVGDPYGPDNVEHLNAAIRSVKVGLVVVGWGDALPRMFEHEARNILHTVDLAGRPARCFGRTKAGRPKHPLARGPQGVSYVTPLEVYR